MFGSRLGWTDLPEDLRGWVEATLGSPVTRATSQPSGFSPGAADRLVTARGDRAFLKAVGSEPNPDSPGLHRREIQVLRTLADVHVVPQLIDGYDDGTWVALIIEDVDGRLPHLPWTGPELSATLAALAQIAAQSPSAPASWPRQEQELSGEMAAWARLRDRDRDGDGADLRLDPWLTERLDDLVDLCAVTLPRMAGEAICHTDLRADNVLIEPDGRVRIVDWPWASAGAPWSDAVMLLVNARWSGEVEISSYLPAVYALGAGHDDVLGLIAGLGGFFTEAGEQPARPGLPTLRAFQRAQARACRSLLQDLWR